MGKQQIFTFEKVNHEMFIWEKLLKDDENSCQLNFFKKTSKYM